MHYSYTTLPFSSFARSALVDLGWNEFQPDKDGVYHVSLEAPGYRKSDLTIEVADETVTVTAANDARGTRTWSGHLPGVNPDKIVARLEDGLLSLECPCIAEVLPRKIEVL